MNTDFYITIQEGRAWFGAKRWWWRINSAWNGQVIATSEIYNTKAACLQTAERVAGASQIQIKAYAE